ncbi:MAG TPA: hypothetical protein VFV75_03835, partial [Candidatus Polarisedimenticolaceae bacterium]|nr:hypothetical protein [Candidatus Polarisedimenticolaceae bacterium]
MNDRAGTRVAALLAVLLGTAFGLHEVVDPDVFQHVAVGRAILDEPSGIGHSSFHDLYPGHAYVEDKPLASVLVALADRWGGEDGLAIYQLLLPALVAGAWYALLTAAGATPWAALAGTALALAAGAYRLEPRPDTWSHALLAGVAILVLRAPGRRLLWALPLLFALWVNLHGYWVTGIVVLLAAALAAALGSAPGPVGAGPFAARRLLLVTLLCIAACAIHPQGWRAVVWPVQQLRLLRQHPEMREAIVEFFPSTALLHGWRAWHGLLAGALVAGGAVLALRRPPLAPPVRAGLPLAAALLCVLLPPPGLAPWPYRLTAALTLAAACELPFAVRERRWFPVLAWSAAVVMALPLVRNLTLLPPLSLWLLVPVWRPPRGWMPALAVVVVLVVAWARLCDHLPPGTPRAPGWTGWGIARDVVPLGAAHYLAEHAPGARICNDFQSGGLLLRELPGHRIFIAGNTSLYPPEHLHLYRAQILTGHIPADALPARFGCQVAVLEHASLETPRLLHGLARSRGWKLVHVDQAAAVFRWDPAGDTPAVDLVSAARAVTDHVSSRSPLPAALLLGRRVFPALNFGIFLRAVGRADLALPIAERLWREGATLELATFRAAAAEEAGVLADEVPFLQDALQKLGTSESLTSRLARALFFRAVRAMAEGEIWAAERDLERSADLRPREAGPWIVLARIAAQRRDLDLARQRLSVARRRADPRALERMIGEDPVL